MVRNDPRVINKLHRRIYFDKLSKEELRLYVSFYIETNSRDAFMAIKQEMLLTFVDIIERQGAKLAVPRIVVGGPTVSSSI